MSETVLWRTEQVERVGDSPWTPPDLALVGAEIIFPLGLAIGDAADPTPIVPGGAAVIAEEAEDPVPLQRPVATHNEPALPRLPLFLWEKDRGATDGDIEGAQKQGRGTHHLLSVRHTLSPSVLSLFAEGSTSITNTHCLN